MQRLIERLNKTEHPALQLVKYGMVGVVNTLVTLIVIVLCKSVLGVNEYVSNALGYAAGILNSFVLNRLWVFHSKGRVHTDMARFFLGCGICYLIQLAIVWVLTRYTFADVEYDLGFFVISGYGIATLIAMVAYTICNFIYNRTIAFSSKPENQSNQSNQSN